MVKVFRANVGGYFYAFKGVPEDKKRQYVALLTERAQQAEERTRRKTGVDKAKAGRSRIIDHFYPKAPVSHRSIMACR